MVSFIDLPGELVAEILKYLDKDTIQSLRRTNSRFNDSCAASLFHSVEKWISEIETINWYKHLTAPPIYALHARQLSILNRSRPKSSTKFYRLSIPAARVHPRMQTITNGVPTWLRSLGERYLRLNETFERGSFVRNLERSVGQLQSDRLEVFAWRHAIPISPENLTYLLSRHNKALKTLDVSEIGPIMPGKDITDFQLIMNVWSLPLNLTRLSIHGVDGSKKVPRCSSDNQFDRLWLIREILIRSTATLKHLRISNEHHASQTFLHSSCIRPLELDHLFFSPDHAYSGPSLSRTRLDPASFVLELESLELGWFKIEHFGLISSSQLLRVNVASLRRLVLEDCDGVIPALENLTVQAGLGNVHLTEFALRHHFPIIPGSFNLADTVYSHHFSQVLERFLTSFNGLEVLSLLFSQGWEGGFELKYQPEAWKKHCSTLKCLVSDVRDDKIYVGGSLPNGRGPINSPANMTQHSGASTYLNFINDYPALSLQEMGTIMNAGDLRIFGRPERGHKDCFMLRLFSQFRDLRAFHIRNFPCLVEPSWSWRNRDGDVPQDAIDRATVWANRVALPYYVADATDFFLQEFHLIDLKVASYHRANSKPPPGVRPPQPKLQLLVIGDWGYRDQMNLAGPRLSDLAYEEGRWSEQEPYTPAWTCQWLPVFFKVEWEWKEGGLASLTNMIDSIEYCHQESTGVPSPGWRAKLTVLKQTTVKGYPELPGGEVKMLDFAWQD